MGLGRVWQELLDWVHPRGFEEGLGDRPSSTTQASDDPAKNAPTGGDTHSEMRLSAEPVTVEPERRSQDPVSETTAPGWVHAEMAPREASGGMGESGLSDEELLEFLAADREASVADPEFKRRLREQLWAIVQEKHLTRQ